MSTDALQPHVAAIAQRHGLGGVSAQRYDSGSLPVFALGTMHVLKLYPPQDQAHAQVEARVLAFVDGRLPVPTPQVVATGEWDGGSYLLMTQLRGRRLVDVWPQLAATERDGLCQCIGEAVATMHALDSQPLADLPPPHWAEFIPAQRHQAVARQRRHGLADAWLEQIEPFLQRWAGPADAEQVLLHTEIMREHLLVEPCRHGLAPERAVRLRTGDARCAGIRVRVDRAVRQRRRCPTRCAASCAAYGYAEAALDHALQNRLMAMALLHRYSKLPWYLQRLPLPGAQRLEQLAAHWWKLGSDDNPSKRRQT